MRFHPKRNGYKGRAIFLDKAKHPWKERFVDPGAFDRQVADYARLKFSGQRGIPAGGLR